MLHALLNTDQPITIDALARQLGVTDAHVRAALEQLTSAGCDMDQHPQSGVRLRRTGLGVWADYLQWSCPWGRTPRTVEVYRQTSSTQQVVRRLIEAMGERSDGAVALADDQTAGRGRLGRRWLAPPGACVLLSRAVVVHATDQPMTVDRLMLASAVAVARAIEAVTAPDPLPVRIKWPNDVTIHGRKIAGILIETVGSAGRAVSGEGTRAASGANTRAAGNVSPESAAAPAAIIGVGVNVNLTGQQLETDPAAPRDMLDRFTSLTICNRPTDRLRVAAETIRQLDATLSSDNLTDLLEHWRQRSELLDERATFQHDGRRITGCAIDLDPHAGLIVRTDTGAIIHLPAATTTLKTDD